MFTTLRRQLLDRDTAHFGRKRRARRARGRCIEQRQRDQSFFDRAMNRIRDKAAGLRSKPIGPTTRLFNVEIPSCIDAAFLDPRLGEPWPEGQADG